MAVTLSNPVGVHTPGAYSHAALVSGATERLVLSGQVGVKPDGSVVEEGTAQIDQALANIGTILDAHAMTQANLVKMTVFLTDPALIPAWRAARGAWLGEHRPASTLLIVAGLADPKFKVEVEAEAAK
ncbi:RidA family protein [Siccirubricoccus phaeus]|uniref:RidA family protein n=1 Tax=Siccirubricoccus phaeus TaxID=2595053 RepID=UPI0011F17E97|nr:RidA family protein [Siccirubricoccus phaeus]